MNVARRSIRTISPCSSASACITARSPHAICMSIDVQRFFDSIRGTKAHRTAATYRHIAERFLSFIIPASPVLLALNPEAEGSSPSWPTVRSEASSLNEDSVYRASSLDLLCFGIARAISLVHGDVPRCAAPGSFAWANYCGTSSPRMNEPGTGGRPSMPSATLAASPLRIGCPAAE
jgi:hypothetical protein